jgi:pectinesterase
MRRSSGDRSQRRAGGGADARRRRRPLRAEDVDIHGHQDTLFVDAGRKRVLALPGQRRVDFVFGGGNALFEDCELRSRHRPGKDRQGYVAVPCTPAAQLYGLTFMRCR